MLALESPSWLVRHPSLPVLYAANETASGAVTALSFSASGALSVLGSAETGGAHPCHLAVTPDGKFLLCANYTGGSLAVFSLTPSGALGTRTALVQHSGSGPVSDRQEAAQVALRGLVEVEGAVGARCSGEKERARTRLVALFRAVREDAGAGDEMPPDRGLDRPL